MDELGIERLNYIGTGCMLQCVIFLFLFVLFLFVGSSRTTGDPLVCTDDGPFGNYYLGISIMCMLL